MKLAEKLENALIKKNEPLTINELLTEINEPLNSVVAREAIWTLIDQDVIELTPERKFRYNANSNNNGHH